MLEMLPVVTLTFLVPSSIVHIHTIKLFFADLKLQTLVSCARWLRDF
jgi:hypothetical protein